MTDRLAALIAEVPLIGAGLERASTIAAPRIQVLPAFEEMLPERGLRPGSMVSITGIGATSLALALVARPSSESWTACVGMPELGLRAGSELGLDLDRLVVVPDPKDQWTDVLAALVDAFDVVLAHPPPIRSAKKLSGRVRERDAVLVVVARGSGSSGQVFQGSDITLEGTTSTWHGIGNGYGHLAARTLEVTVSGRRAAARPRTTTLWLPDVDGEIRPCRSEAEAQRGGNVTDLMSRARSVG